MDMIKIFYLITASKRKQINLMIFRYLERKNTLKMVNFQYEKDGVRDECIKVTNCTIKFIITLNIFSLTLFSASIVIYLKSPLDTNNKNPVSERTVQKCLLKQKFPVKKQHFHLQIVIFWFFESFGWYSLFLLKKLLLIRMIFLDSLTNLQFVHAKETNMNRSKDCKYVSMANQFL